MSEQGFEHFLKDTIGLDPDAVSKLMEGGFDDEDSLKLAKADTLRLVGINNPEEVYKLIRAVLGDEHEEADNQITGVLDQEGYEIQDL